MARINVEVTEAERDAFKLAVAVLGTTATKVVRAAMKDTCRAASKKRYEDEVNERLRKGGAP